MKPGIFFLLLACLLALTACANPAPAPTNTPAATLTPVPLPSPTPTPVPSPTPTPLPSPTLTPLATATEAAANVPTSIDQFPFIQEPEEDARMAHIEATPVLTKTPTTRPIEIEPSPYGIRVVGHWNENMALRDYWQFVNTDGKHLAKVVVEVLNADGTHSYIRGYISGDMNNKYIESAGATKVQLMQGIQSGDLVEIDMFTKAQDPQSKVYPLAWDMLDGAPPEVQAIYADWATRTDSVPGAVAGITIDINEIVALKIQ